MRLLPLVPARRFHAHRVPRPLLRAVPTLQSSLRSHVRSFVRSRYERTDDDAWSGDLRSGTD